MKIHNILLQLILFSGVLLLGGCGKNLPEALDGKTAAAIEISYTYAEKAVQSLQFNSASRSVSVGVSLNNQDIYWNVESDALWCSVAEESHRGDGSFTLNISANEDYSDRAPATLTFVAGQYRGATLQVSQSGNVFIVNKIFAVSGKGSGTEEIEVSVEDGVEWEIVGTDWVRAEKEASPVSADGVTKTRVTVSWDENTGASRLSSVGLCRAGSDEPDSRFSVFQFGDELSYDESGVIVLPARDCPEVKVTVPGSSVNGVELPEWITYTAQKNSDNTDTYSLCFADNPSDTRSTRTAGITLDVVDKDADVTLPAMRQEYYSVYGITSAAGFALFASAVNSGADISEWQQTDGKIVLLNNIDMSGLDSEWTSAGTEEHPFTGIFDGRYRKILNLKASEPLFGVCEGATLSNVVIDASSAFSFDGDYLTQKILAPLAASLSDCTVSECENNAPVSISASSLNGSTAVYVAGLVGKTVGTTTLSLCTNNGAVSDAAVARNHYIGGLVAHNSGSLKDLRNCGKLTISALRVVNGANDMSRYISMGGIAGWNAENGSISLCTNDGVLLSESDVKIQRIGAVAGYLEGAAVSGNRNTGNGVCSIVGAATAQRGVRQLYLGGLYGEIGCDATLDFSADGDVSAGALNVSEWELSTSNSTIFVGGLVGRSSGDACLTLKHPRATCSITLNLKGNKFASYALGVGGVIGGAGIFEESTVSGGLLCVEDASAEGSISLSSSSSYTLQNKYAGVGGIVGLVSTGGANLLRCSNSAKIAQSESCARSNGYAQHVGGIVGIIMGGDSSIKDCSNTGEIDNEHYNNNPWTGSGLQCGSAGGILGAYGYNNAYEGSLVVSSCTNAASVKSFRGMAGGVAGYVRSASLSGCSNTGTMANGNRSYIGGVIGIADSSTILSCSALCNVGGASAGSEVLSAGGVVGILNGSSTCTDSSFFGDITTLTPDKAGESAGSIAGSSTSLASISGCKSGGSVLGAEVTLSNYSSLVCGDANATVSSCTLWNGK